MVYFRYMYLWLVFFVGFLLGGLAVHWASHRGLAWQHRGTQSESYPALRATVVAHLQMHGTLNVRTFETLTETSRVNAQQYLEAMESEGLICLHRRPDQKGGFYTLA